MNALAWGLERDSEVRVLVESAFLVTISYVARVLDRDRRAGSGAANGLVAYAVGVAVFLPLPRARRAGSSSPGLRGSRSFGLAVPAALVEGLGFRAAFVRGYRLARVGLRPRARRARDARARRLPDAGRRSSSSCASTRRTPGSLRRRSPTLVVSPLLFLGARAAVRRPGGSVRLARRPRKGARCPST